MELKTTLMGGFVYAALSLYLAAWLTLLPGFKKPGRMLFCAGFFAALSGVVYRGYTVSRFPMQSMFEIFLFMGMLACPVSLACRRLLPGADETMDPLIGALLLFPAGLIFDAAPQSPPPILRHWLFGPHVAAYLLGYVMMFKAGASAAKLMFLPVDGTEPVRLDEEIRGLVRLGFPPLTLGLILGACWGKIAWGAFWNWDPKEMWALAMWLVYAGYFHMRGAARGGSARLNAAIVLLGCAVILGTLLWAGFSRLFAGLHSYI